MPRAMRSTCDKSGRQRARRRRLDERVERLPAVQPAADVAAVQGVVVAVVVCRRVPLATISLMTQLRRWASHVAIPHRTMAVS